MAHIIIVKGPMKSGKTYFSHQMARTFDRTLRPIHWEEMLALRDLPTEDIHTSIFHTDIRDITQDDLNRLVDDLAVVPAVLVVEVRRNVPNHIPPDVHLVLLTRDDSYHWPHCP